MKREHYREYALVKLDKPLRVRCCNCAPFPAGLVVACFKRTSPNRAMVGNYVPPEANPFDYHHDVMAIGGAGTIEEAQAKGTMFPRGGFCLHRVKVSGISGPVVGELNPGIFKPGFVPPTESQPGT